MKKLLLTLGSIATIVTPIGVVISCGSTSVAPETTSITTPKTEALTHIEALKPVTASAEKGNAALTQDMIDKAKKVVAALADDATADDVKTATGDIMDQIDAALNPTSFMAGKRVFHVGEKMDGSALDWTAGMIQDGIGPMGFDTLLGYAKHGVTTEEEMLVAGDKIVITVNEHEVVHIISATEVADGGAIKEAIDLSGEELTEQNQVDVIQTKVIIAILKAFTDMVTADKRKVVEWVNKVFEVKFSSHTFDFTAITYEFNYNNHFDMSIFEDDGILKTYLDNTGVMRWGDSEQKITWIKRLLYTVFDALKAASAEDKDKALTNVAKILKSIDDNNDFVWDIHEDEVGNFLKSLKGSNLLNINELIANINENKIKIIDFDFLKYIYFTNSNGNISCEIKPLPIPLITNVDESHFGADGDLQLALFNATKDTYGDKSLIKNILYSISSVYGTSSVNILANVINAIGKNTSISWGLNQEKASLFLDALKVSNFNDPYSIVDSLNAKHLVDNQNRIMVFSVTFDDVEWIYSATLES